MADSLIYEIPKFAKNTRSNFFTNRCTFSEPLVLHSHKYIEIAFVESGNGIHKIGADSYECQMGDLYIINSDIPHTFIPNEGEKFIVCNCVFIPEFFDSSLIGDISFKTLSNVFLFRPFYIDEANSYFHLRISSENYNKIKNKFNDIYNEYLEQSPGFLELIRAYMIELLIFILRQISNTEDSQSKKSKNTDVDNIITKKILSYIKEHFNDNLTNGELAMLAFLSPVQFCRVFKNTTGLTVKAFMQKVRIEIACKLLTTTNKSIEKIAYDVGYQDVKYFSNLFLKLTGLTPTKFRKENR